jgi:hypothetical protein
MGKSRKAMDSFSRRVAAEGEGQEEQAEAPAVQGETAEDPEEVPGLEDRAVEAGGQARAEPVSVDSAQGGEKVRDTEALSDILRARESNPEGRVSHNPSGAKCSATRFSTASSLQIRFAIEPGK